MFSHEESHPVRHLNDFDRRKFLKTAGLVTGLAFLGNLIETNPAFGATNISLPGFAAFSKSVKIIGTNNWSIPKNIKT